MSEFGRSGREWSETQESRTIRRAEFTDDGWDEAIKAADSPEGNPLDAPYRTQSGRSRFEPNDIQLAFREPSIILTYRAAPPAERAKMEAALTASLDDARLLLTSTKAKGVVGNALSKLTSGNDRYPAAVISLSNGIDALAKHYDSIPKGVEHAPTVLDVGTLLMTCSEYTSSPSASLAVSKMWFGRALGESARKGAALTTDLAKRQLKTLDALQRQAIVPDSRSRSTHSQDLSPS